MLAASLACFDGKKFCDIIGAKFHIFGGRIGTPVSLVGRSFVQMCSYAITRNIIIAAFGGFEECQIVIIFH